jgi:hypothetical protein
MIVGESEGDADGRLGVSVEGRCVGISEGIEVDGSVEGWALGFLLGIGLGLFVLGAFDGIQVGPALGF